MMRRIATVDVGTNTANFLLADWTPEGGLTPVAEGQRFVRLGEGVDAQGLVQGAAIDRLVAALHAFQAQTQAAGGADAMVIGATSASRDARNKAELIARVRRETGLDYEILSGEEEATWTFEGACSAWPDREGPCAVLDIGGGSSELVVGTPGREGALAALSYRHSFDVGARRMTERFFSRLPPAPGEEAATAAYVADVLAADGSVLPPGVPLLGAAGTITTLALVHAGVRSWADVPTGEVVLTAADVHHWRRRLLDASAEAVAAINPAVLAERADVVGAGVLLFDVFMTYLGVPTCTVTPRGLRHGLALRYGRGQ